MGTILGAPGWRRAAAVAALGLTAVLAASSLAGAADRGERVPRRADSVRVEIDDFAYRPATLRIGRGTRVVFVNRDRTAHTATRRGSFDSGRIGGGRAAAVRFKRRGTYRYFCRIHPFMHGKIVVR